MECTKIDKEYLASYDIHVLGICPKCTNKLKHIDFNRNKVYCSKCKNIYKLDEV